MTDEKELENFARRGFAAQKAVDEQIAKSFRDPLEYWLPEDCRLDLTQLELGALFAILAEARRFGLGSAIINKPGPHGEPVPISIISRLIEKVEKSITERKSR